MFCQSGSSMNLSLVLKGRTSSFDAVPGMLVMNAKVPTASSSELRVRPNTVTLPVSRSTSASEWLMSTKLTLMTFLSCLSWLKRTPETSTYFCSAFTLAPGLAAGLSTLVAAAAARLEAWLWVTSQKTPRPTPRNAKANRMASAQVGSTVPERCLGGGGGGAAANNGDCEYPGSYAGGGGGAGRNSAGGGAGASGGGCGSLSGGWDGAGAAVFAAQSGHSLYDGGTSRPHCGQIHVNMCLPQLLLYRAAIPAKEYRRPAARRAEERE